MSLTLRTISREQHLAYIQSLPSASHMQVPAWADVKAEWRSENLGWFDDRTGELVGAGLVLYRQLPKIKRYLAYLPEGPVINWFAPNLQEWLEPMLAHLKQQGAFSVKMGPPVIIRRWEAPSIKAGIQNPDVKRLRDIEADHIEPRAFEVADKLRRMGWQQGEDGGAGFGDVQPRYVYQVPLANRSLEEVHQELRTSCGAATSRRPRRPASRSSRAATRTSRNGSGCTRSRPCATTSGRARCRTSSACGRPSTARTPTACGCTSPGTTA
ncbi:Lipid II:glycine glycyltransferase (Peptidoglycan interpeptide bridge formation enzyme) OS=Streptomyces violarus OX=67380 GN=FHS41_004289 PE=3 SV=1 [Streptomyces violarus]